MDTLECLDMVLVLFSVKDIKDEVIFDTTFFYNNKISQQELEKDLYYQYGDNFVGICNISR